MVGGMLTRDVKSGFGPGALASASGLSFSSPSIAWSPDYFAFERFASRNS